MHIAPVLRMPWNQHPGKSLGNPSILASIVRVEQHPATARLCKNLDVASGAPLTGLFRQAQGPQCRVRAGGHCGVVCKVQMSLSWGARVAWLALCLLHSNSCPALGIAGAG